jgi:hypothetical protein
MVIMEDIGSIDSNIVSRGRMVVQTMVNMVVNIQSYTDMDYVQRVNTDTVNMGMVTSKLNLGNVRLDSVNHTLDTVIVILKSIAIIHLCLINLLRAILYLARLVRNCVTVVHNINHIRMSRIEIINLNIDRPRIRIMVNIKDRLIRLDNMININIRSIDLNRFLNLNR